MRPIRNQIKIILANKGRNFGWLAEKMGGARSSMTRLLNLTLEELTPKTLGRLVKALGVRAEVIVGEERVRLKEELRREILIELRHEFAQELAQASGSGASPSPGQRCEGTESAVP